MKKRRPIFSSTMQAIHVSYMLAGLPPTSRGNTQSVIDWMRDRLGKPEPLTLDVLRTMDWEGHSREEVRAQCAQVRKMVEKTCYPPEVHAFRAKFANDHTKAEGVRYFGDYLQDRGVELRELKMHLLWWLCMDDRQRKDAGLSLRAFEAKYAKDHVTLSRVASKWGDDLSKLRNIGVKRMEPRFVRGGLVMSETEPVDAHETTTP